LYEEIAMEMQTQRRRGEALASADALKVYVETRAACRGKGVAMFFPDKGDAAGEQAAKAVCDRCIVRAECLRWAMETREPYGVLGGLTEAERRQLRRRRTARDRRVRGRAETPAPRPDTTSAAAPPAPASPRERRRAVEGRAS
jgi:WhiB family transcriptional regulator, redox-sensing transcriptional regulator